MTTAPAIVLRLRPSKRVLAIALVLVASVCVVLAHSVLSRAWRFAGVVSMCVVGVAALQNLAHGLATRSVARIEWLDGNRWLLTRGSPRREVTRSATLARGSRRIGRTSLLVFRRGVFGRWDRPWLLVLDCSVSDRGAARRLRARLSVDQARMLG